MIEVFIFTKTLANFDCEQSLSSYLIRLGLDTTVIDFVPLSHLHWDHVSGIPDLPEEYLIVQRLEQERTPDERSLNIS